MAGTDRGSTLTAKSADQDLLTRCPECLTTFHVNTEQLTERNGLVRCGRCQAVFRGDQHLQSGKSVATDARADRAAGTVRSNKPSSVDEDDNPAYQAPLPTAKELLFGVKPSASTRPLFWLLGVVVLGLLLPLQYVYFYSSELALHPSLAPYVTKACEVMGCTIKPWQDVNLMELSNPVVQPHHKYENALHIEVTLINRAQQAQPFPRMEISLIDRQGAVISRRQFLPKHYLEPAQSNTLMHPNVAIPVKIEVTHPSDRTEGHEIRLLPI